MYSTECPENVEPLRESYKPERVEVLLVGESPPGIEQGFFYCRNGSRLGCATREAFEEALQIKFDGYEDFLKFFRSRGFYLEDLFHERDRKTFEVSIDELRKAVRDLADRISLYRPRLVIAVLCKICECVKRAAIEAGVDVPVVCLPFPIGGNYPSYVKGLAETLQQLLRGGPLEDRNYCSDRATSKKRRHCLKLLREIHRGPT